MSDNRGGNIFSVMGTASKTLKNSGMTEESKKMCSRVTSSGSLGVAVQFLRTEIRRLNREINSRK